MAALKAELIAEALAGINKSLKHLEERLEFFGTAERRNLEAAAKEPFETPKEEIKKEITFPVPQEYRDIVDKILNKSFEVEIGPAGDPLQFHFSVSVPKKYSDAPEPYWLTYKKDIRLKVIDKALGENGVREWCEMIFNRCPADIQALITSDRINN